VRYSLALCFVVGCSSASSNETAVPDSAVEEDPIFGGDRPVPFFRAPEGYDRKKPIPLVIILHGFGAGGYAQAAFFNMTKLVEEKKFLLVAPDGTPDKSGRRFWNAVPECCDFDRKGIDDVKFITGLVDEIATRWNVDRKRIFLLGHSNGGAMSYRLACDAAPKFAAAVTLAPPFYNDTTKCNPSEPVAIRHMHGTKDETVPYEGGSGFPPVQQTIAAWAKWNGCAAPDTTAAPLDIDQKVVGAETKVTRWTGCKPNGDTELWTMEGSTHIPFDLSPELPARIWAFFEAHPKP
jgi:polyhydroxybutyrate depolymerase